MEVDEAQSDASNRETKQQPTPDVRSSDPPNDTERAGEDVSNARADTSSAPPQPGPASLQGSRSPRKVIEAVQAPDGQLELPALFQFAPVDDIIELLSHMLTRLMEHNDKIPLTPASLTRFHSRAPPGISVSEYLQRIAKYTNAEACCLLIVLYYVDRLSEKLPTFTISSLTVHRFVIAAVAASSKAISDSFCTNGRYAKVGGVSLAEMNVLEKELLSGLEYRLTTQGNVLATYYSSLVQAHPRYRISPAPLPVDVVDPTQPDTLPPKLAMPTTMFADAQRSLSQSPTRLQQRTLRSPT